MFRLIPVLAVLALGLPDAASPTAKIGTHTFTLPEGFEIELVAGPPLVDRPITADFDEQGRLYVSDSSGSNDKVDIQLKERPHRILRLVDTDGDGKFDAKTVFADRMMFPEGTMWHDGSLYVAAPPSIWKLTDTNDDGVADERVEWFQGKTLTGCANDLHGPYAGPDGWIYWCKGAFAEQTYERPGKKPLVTKASHIFRCRPDGSGIEAVMTGGMDNPVDTVFTRSGDRIFTTTFLQQPAGGLRDGLIHAVYGGVYGKQHGVLDGHPRTGELMPVLAHLGAAAPCGLVRCESDQLGEGFQDNVFAALFNMHKVTRHVLTPEGATYKSETSDFVVSDNLDFHPTDVLEDADGSLLVVDTGGWYKLCCPTSQLWKPDMLGGIYRVKRKGAKPVDDPRGRTLDWAKMSPDDLGERLGDPRPAVRRRAIAELARLGPKAIRGIGVALLPFEENPHRHENALWAAARIEGEEFRKIARMVVDGEEPYALVALHSISLWKDKAALPEVLDALKSDSPRLRRAAAEALGRIGDASDVPALLDAAATAGDRFEEHSITYALMEIAEAQATQKGLESNNPQTRRTALIALDQMEPGGLKPADVAGLLGSPDPLLRETAAWIVDRHPDWGDALAGYLREKLASPLATEDDRLDLRRQLTRFSRAQSVQSLLIGTLGDAQAPLASRVLALEAMAGGGWKELPAECLTAVLAALSSGPAELRGPAVTVLRQVPVAKPSMAAVAEALLPVARREDVPAAVRADALAAVPGGLASVDDALFAFLKQHVGNDQEVLVRATAADALSRAKLTPAQLSSLTEVFAEIGPLEADRVLQAYKDVSDEGVGLKLMAALKESSAVTALRVDTLKASLAKATPAVQAAGQHVFAALNVDPQKQKEKLDGLLASMKPGDVRRGQLVFHSQKAACASCHAMGYLGGRVGPDLTRIAQIRNERDLLEAIVFPSASFVRSYEPTLVLTLEGKVHSGILTAEHPELILLTGPRDEVRIRRDQVDEVRPGTVSVMPSGLDQQLSAQDLADLIAFLKAAR